MAQMGKPHTDLSAGTRGWNLHWSSSGSKVSLFMILFFSSGGMKFSMIRYLHEDSTQRHKAFVSGPVRDERAQKRFICKSGESLGSAYRFYPLSEPFLFQCWELWDCSCIWCEWAVRPPIQPDSLILLTLLDAYWTHLNLSSLVSSFWVCSSSWRLLTCSLFTSFISAL